MALSSGSFDNLDDEELRTHLNIAKYDAFLLTDAVRPSYDLTVKPIQGYRRDDQPEMPTLTASVSGSILLDTFMTLLDNLIEHSSSLNVVLMSSHDQQPREYFAIEVDPIIIKSIIYDFEEVIIHDGCTGIAVYSEDSEQEVQLDEHKLIFVYNCETYQPILEQLGINRIDSMKVITEAEHVHSTSEAYCKRFDELLKAFSIDAEDE